MAGKTKELFAQLQRSIEDYEESMTDLEKESTAYENKLEDELSPMGKPPKEISPMMARLLADDAEELGEKAGQQARLLQKVRALEKELMKHLTERLSRTKDQEKVKTLIGLANQMTV